MNFFLFICSAWTNKLITAKDHASVQINIGHLDANGVYNGNFTTFALAGNVRAMVRRAAEVSQFGRRSGGGAQCFTGFAKQNSYAYISTYNEINFLKSRGCFDLHVLGPCLRSRCDPDTPSHPPRTGRGRLCPGHHVEEEEAG